MPALCIAISVFGYILCAGSMYASFDRLFDERFWSGYGAPGKTEMSWAWPITIACAIFYWVVWPPLRFVFRFPAAVFRLPAAIATHMNTRKIVRDYRARVVKR